jgi:hypothetical protein
MAPPLPAPTLADVAFVIAVVALTHAARRAAPAYALLVLPGTLLHELAHWLVGAFTGARPGAVRLVPVKSADGRRWSLGAVGFRRIAWFNALPVAVAPLVLAPLALVLGALALALPAGDWRHWGGLYSATAVALSCLPSRSDWAIAFSRPLGTLAWLVLIGAGAWLLHVGGLLVPWPGPGVHP